MAYSPGIKGTYGLFFVFIFAIIYLVGIFGGGIMNGNERRKNIVEMLKDTREPLSGTYLSKILKVSRQVIVQDIALLRAEGYDIMATPQGYVIPSHLVKSFRRTIACVHGSDGIEDELKTIVSMGGKVIDVSIEHPVYGELKGMLMLSSIYDVDEFMRRLKESMGQPLLVLTKGVHVHTIEGDSEHKLDMIENKLRKKGYLINPEI